MPVITASSVPDPYFSVILKSYGIAVKGTGAVSKSWTVLLQGSLDNVNFSTILTHSTTTGDGAVLWSGSVLSTALHFRINVTSLNLGSASNIVVRVVGTD